MTHDYRTMAGGDVLDDDAELFDGPRVDYAVEVTYPADHDSLIAIRAAGRPVRFRCHGGGARWVAEHRAKFHLAHGAKTAVVVERTWTVSDWQPSTDQPERHRDAEELTR